MQFIIFPEITFLLRPPRLKMAPMKTQSGKKNDEKTMQNKKQIGKTKFQDSWLEKTDDAGINVKLYMKKSSDAFYGFCVICNENVCTSAGFAKIMQHAKTKKHVNNMFKINNSQSTITGVVTGAGSSNSCSPSGSTSTPYTEMTKKKATPQMVLFNSRDPTTEAELLWACDNVYSNYSLNSNVSKKQLFQRMWRDAVPSDFSISPTKVAYLITEALGPHFLSLLLQDLQPENIYVVLQFDETNNNKGRDELQVRLRFWPDNECRVVNRHLTTRFIDQKDAKTIFNHILGALSSSGISLKRVLTLAMDGPNVNKSIFKLFQTELTSKGCKELIDIGSCLIHVVHNTFLHGLECLSIDVSDFIIKVYYFFDNRAKRWKEFEDQQRKLKLPKHKFIKHASTRWLTLKDAAERVLEQFPALLKYFLEHIALKDSITAKRKAYIDIVEYLKNPLLQGTLHFAVFLSKIYTKNFTELMQREEPLIHILYQQLEKIIKLLMSNFLKSSAIQEVDFGNLVEKTRNAEQRKQAQQKLASILDKHENVLQDSDVQCGEKTKDAVSVSKLTKHKPKFYSDVKKCYKTSINYLFKKVEAAKILKCFQCLIPENIKNAESIKYIKEIASQLPIENVDIDCLVGEWRLLQMSKKINFTKEKGERIDEYWNKIFVLKNEDYFEFPIVKIIVKAALSLTHGNAEVERGFSISKRALSEEQANMSEKMLNAKLHILDYLKSLKIEPYELQIPPELLKLAKNAHRSYTNYLAIEEKKRLQEKEDAEKNAEKVAHDKAILEAVNQKTLTIDELQEDIKIALIKYNEAKDDVNKMRMLYKDCKSSASEIFLLKIEKNLEEMTERERTTSERVHQLQALTLKRKSEVIELQNKKQKLLNS